MVLLTEAVRKSLLAFPASTTRITLQLSAPGGPTVTHEVDLGSRLIAAHGAEVDVSHDPDYRRCVWHGETFRFTPTQARCVAVLWQALREGTPELAQATILREANSCQAALREVFRQRRGGVHPAWGTMIVPQAKGVYRLKVPGGTGVPV